MAVMLHLTEHDPRLQDYIDGSLPAAERARLEKHLARCPECAILMREYDRLDHQLADLIHRPSLSRGFHAHLLAQIDSPIACSGAPPTPQQRQQLERDFETQWQAHRRHFWRAQLPSFLDSLGYSAGAAIGGSLLLRLITIFLHALGTASTIQAQHLALALSTAVGATILLAALAFVAKTHLTRWLA